MRIFTLDVWKAGPQEEIEKSGTILCQKYYFGQDIREFMSSRKKEGDLERKDVCAFLYAFSLYVYIYWKTSVFWELTIRLGLKFVKYAAMLVFLLS